MRVVRAAAATDPGRKRKRNEDAYVVEPPLFEWQAPKIRKW